MDKHTSERRAEILCVGTELLLGDIVNTNAAYIARGLANIGIDVYYQSVVGDNPERLKSYVGIVFSRSDILIMTGGLGPTYDDLTKETLAEYFQLPMEMDQPALDSIESFFKKINRPMTENNKKQAMMPQGAKVFYNQWGTAPGLAVSKNGKMAIMLPGPPSEMEPMFDQCVVPYLMELSNKVLVSRNIRLFGIGESQLEDILFDLMKTSTNPTVAPYAKRGEVSLRVTATGKTEEECNELINPMIDKIYGYVGKYIYGIDIPSLQHALVEMLKEKKLKIATAESCTGGLISQLITQISGASEVFDCGACTYANNIKTKLLGVKESTLQEYGAVSEQTAAEMAAGIRAFADADIGISTTGIAGPDGGTKDKPVGTVYVGINSNAETKVIKLDLSWRRAEDERQNIRYRSAQHAIFLAWQVAQQY